MKQVNNSKKKELIRMKNFALLVLSIAVLLFGIGFYFNIGWLKAFSEAAMVGGIADWFAVVALFRHPLGLPIPHTALIPKNKDTIGENLGNFVSEEFLIREKLEIKLDQFNVGGAISNWLIQPKNATVVSELVAQHLIPRVLKTIDDTAIQHFIQKQFGEKLRNSNFAEWIALALETVANSDQQEQLVTSILKTLSVELQNNKDSIEEKVKKSTPFLSFGLADKRIAEGVFNGLYDFLEQASWPDSLIRKKVNTYINDYIQELKTSEEMQQKINDYVLSFASKNEVIAYVNGIWLEIKNRITHDIDQGQESGIKKAIAAMILSFGIGIKEDISLIEKINTFVKNDVLSVVLANKKLIGDLIASTVKSWEADEVTEKLELQMGKDLQFIRINGTVVGGLVGLFLYFLTHYLN